jgi:hypothetical protein
MRFKGVHGFLAMAHEAGRLANLPQSQGAGVVERVHGINAEL